MDIIKEINETLKKHNLEVKFGNSSEDKEIREAKWGIYCDKPIEAQYILLEVQAEKQEEKSKEPKKITQVSTWNELLNKIKREYGDKFFRDNNLSLLRENRYSSEDK